ncbi:MAG: XdhC/CoxI family protein [Dehalococcoidia bacterium]|nr:XdhC/CoxI family protein [Dehalococcoidia bacterium]
MDVVYSEAVNTLGKGLPCAIATVIRTKGSTPQKPGARLLVQANGLGAGTLGGGCVEAEVRLTAQNLLLKGGKALLEDFTLNDELAALDGLECGGTMSFLIQPVADSQLSLDHIREVVAAHEGGQPVAFVSLISRPLGSDFSIGTHLFVRENGESVGTLGHARLDEFAVEKSRELMAHGKCALLVSPEGAEIFVEAHTLPPTLVLCGGGHVAKAMAPLAKMLGFRLYVIDDRPEFVNPERFPEADKLVHASYDEGLKQLHISANTYILVATRGHRLDDVATEAAARSPATWVGLVGSKRKSILVLEELFRKGVPEERIRQIRAPVGLDIGARTPAEISVSIVAEMLMLRLGGAGRPLKMADRLFLKAREKSEVQPAGKK